MLAKFNFLLILLNSYKKKHLSIFLLSTLLIFIIASMLFLKTSLQKEFLATLDEQADFTIQHYESGHLLNAPQKWVDEFLNIQGVSSAEGRIYGEHYYEPKEQHFLIVGIDFYDTQVTKTMQQLMNKIDIEQFLSKKQMIIGAGVKDFFDKYQYFDNYIFRPPDRSKEKVYIYKSFPKVSNIVTSDMIIMDKAEARKILGIKKGYVSDIILNVKNPNERQKVYEKLIISHFNTRIITKEDIAHHYKNLFNYKGGIFLALYIVVILTFLLILYQRYNMITTHDTKEVAILRSCGWKIDAIIWLKIYENAIVAISAYLFGTLFAYVYVYFFKAPILQSIFLGSSNLTTNVDFIPAVDKTDLALLFGIFVIPFLFAIIIPLWKLSTQELSKVIR